MKPQQEGTRNEVLSVEIKRLSSRTKTWLLDVLVNSAVELGRKRDNFSEGEGGVLEVILC